MVLIHAGSGGVGTFAIQLAKPLQGLPSQAARITGFVHPFLRYLKRIPEVGADRECDSPQ